MLPTRTLSVMVAIVVIDAVQRAPAHNTTSRVDLECESGRVDWSLDATRFGLHIGAGHLLRYDGVFSVELTTIPRGLACVMVEGSYFLQMLGQLGRSLNLPRRNQRLSFPAIESPILLTCLRSKYLISAN